MTFDPNNVPPPHAAPLPPVAAAPRVLKPRAYVQPNAYAKGAWFIAIAGAIVAVISGSILIQNEVTLYSSASDIAANAGASAWLTISVTVMAGSIFLGLLIGGIEQALVNVENYRNDSR